MRCRFPLASCVLLASLCLSPFLAAQTASQRPAETTVALSPNLLPVAGFADWKATGEAPAATEPSFSLVNANKAALEECSPQRSAVANYTGPQGKALHVEAMEAKDASGALAALSILSQPGMHAVEGLGTVARAGDGGVVFVSGAVVAVAFPATAADLPTLKALAAVLPKPTGSQALQPLLPTLLPTRGLQSGSLRYALGPRSYMSEGGVLPAAGLGWDKEAEAVTARYSDKRGEETLTLLLYPTPTIAGAHQRQIESQLAGLGPGLSKAKTRREGSLLILANGSFSSEAATALTENTHLHQLATTDKAMPTPEVVQTRQTFGTLANIIVLSGVLCLAALLLGLFLGGFRAVIRVLRGKPAATELEFLSLHLEPQNQAPVFTTGEHGGQA